MNAGARDNSAVETVACNLCGSPARELLFRARDEVFGGPEDFGIVRCASCGLVYLSPRPVKETMAAHYPPDYQAEIRELIQRMRSSPLLQRGLAMLRKRRTPPVAVPGKVLDVGCSFGDYLLYLQGRGWSVEGIEQDPEAARHGISSGLRVHEGDAEQVIRELPAETYDVVTLWHLLEHLYDPAAFLAEVRRVLKPNGLVMTELPSYASLLAGWMGTYWYPLEVPRHLYHFPPDTLGRLLERTGFSVQGIRGIPAPEAIVWSLRLLWRARLGARSAGSHGTLHLNPLLAVAAFPASWALCRLGMADHIGVQARKTGAGVPVT